ncbi:unnamed protein product [Ixodes persulcatus]
MGVDLSTYRIRVGCFFSRKRCRAFRHPRRNFLLVKFLCPSAKILLVSLCCAQLLLCAGDVETNPGPDDKIDQVLANLNQVMTSNETYQKETSAVLAVINAGITDISKRVSILEESLREVTKLREDVKSLDQTVSTLQTEMGALTYRQRGLESIVDVVDDLNNRLRRNNVIVKGLPELERETWNDTENKIREFLSTHLKVNPGEIERAHRIGQHRAGTSRPIVIKFLNFKSKSEVQQNAHKLKNLESPKIWIEDDFSPRLQIARKKLRDFAKINRGASRFRLSYDKLILNDVTYAYDANTDQVVCIPRDNLRDLST